MLAIGGGIGMCVVVLWAIVYLPLHYHEPLNSGDSLQFGDLLALLSGIAAIGIGVLTLARRVRNPRGAGVVVVLAGVPTLVLAILWSFPETFHLSIYPVPFYIGYLYFANFGLAHIGSGYVPLPLIGSTLAVIVGVLMALSGPAMSPARAGGR